MQKVLDIYMLYMYMGAIYIYMPIKLILPTAIHERNIWGIHQYKWNM